uniref:UDP-glycosyltransferase n=1 Tax=Photinus pyralis TaxID=7054 RepID=A0A1Y1NPQ7_PHOPY
MSSLRQEVPEFWSFFIYNLTATTNSVISFSRSWQRGATELAARGHEVTLITGYETKENVTNLKTIVVNTHLKGISANMFRMSEGSMLWSNMKFDNYLLSVAEGTLSDDNVQALIKSKEHFDVVILERLRNEAFHGFCAHFKAHCVLSTSMPASRLINLQLGNSAPPSYVPEMCSTFSNNMNFFERLSNAFAYVFLTIWYRSYMQPLHNNLMHKHFPDVPDLSDIFHNISLVLINAHTATNPPVPLLPNMIDIGGYHIRQPEPLSEDLKAYLDSSNEGVILVSMGSILRSAYISDSKREAILNALGNLPQNVLWKWDEESMPNQPRNIRLVKWLLQNDVLGSVFCQFPVS